VTNELNTTLLARLGWYVAERQATWHRRQLGITPWSPDPVMSSNHFTNVYRELDPGTIYAQEQLSQLDELRDRMWFAVAYRLVNRRSTFEEYPGGFGCSYTDEWLAYLEDRYQRGLTVKTNRHLTPRREWYEKALRTIPTFLPRDASAAFKTLHGVTGVGVFTGWQIHCDLVQFGDIDYDPSFVVVGDGASYSISCLYGQRRFADYWHDGRAGTNIGRKRAVGGRVRSYAHPWFKEVLLWLVDQQVHWLPSYWQPWDGRALDPKNVEHSLCEWLRYERHLIKDADATLDIRSS
jgi:hypothetical protein